MDLINSKIKPFISYSSADEKIVLRIVEILEKLGLSYYLDKKEIEWGVNISKDLHEGLIECTHIIVIISSDSINSSWVPFELGIAKALNKTILPFVSRPNIELPGYLQGLHYKTELNEVNNYFLKQIYKDQPWSKLLSQKVLSLKANKLIENGTLIGLNDYASLHICAAQEPDVKLIWVGTPIKPNEWVTDFKKNGYLYQWFKIQSQCGFEIQKSSSFKYIFPIRFCFWDAELLSSKKQIDAVSFLAKKHSENGICLIYINPEKFTPMYYDYEKNFSLQTKYDFAIFVRSNYDSLMVCATDTSIDTPDRLNISPMLVKGRKVTGLYIKSLLKIISTLQPSKKYGYSLTSSEINKMTNEPTMILGWPKESEVTPALKAISKWASNAIINIR